LPDGIDEIDTGRAILRAESLTKRFGGTTVVDSASLVLQAGRVHALVGENGAGKSTVIKMLSGAERPDLGRIVLDGNEVSFRNPADGAAAKIATVYQELDLIDELTVAENVMLAREPRRGPFISTRRLNEAARAALARAGSSADLAVSPRLLSLAQQQRLVIARSLLAEAKVLILDEPTAALGPREVEDLFSLVRELTATGVAVLFVSHRLEEVLDIADTVTVMRDGRVVTTQASEDLDENAIINQMTGRTIDLSAVRQSAEPPAGMPVLTVSGLPLANGTLELTVRPGEIIGIAGLAGSGRSRLLRNIVGAPWAGGSVCVDGKPFTRLDPSSALLAGIGYLPEDRKRDGLVLEADAPFNVALSSLVKSRSPMTSGRRESVRFLSAIKSFSLRGDPAGPVGRLSGGNQQKVLLARILATHPRVLLLDEPTRGVDIGAKKEIWDLLESAAETGIAIVVVSSELPEVLRLSDRILVLSEGRLTGTFPAGTSQETLIQAAVPRREPSANAASESTSRP
jgi:ribose transport system ATP-binding protein